MALDDSYSKVLLHMDGADGSQTFTDESGKTWTANGNASVGTAQSVFGGAAGYFNNNGYITTPDHADFAFGSGDFTIDTWFRATTNSVRQYIIANIKSDGAGSSQSFELRLGTGIGNGSLRGGIFSGSTGYFSTGAAGSFVANTWYHFALVRYGNTLTAYLDGNALDAGADVTGVTVNDPAQVETIGRWGNRNEYYYNGWLDEFRISKGIARWTGNFTPPTSAYAPLLTSSQRVRTRRGINLLGRHGRRLVF